MKAVSWTTLSKEDKYREDDKLSPARLLNSCPVLQSDDSEDDCSSVLAKRAHVLMEKDFAAGVQQLRVKRPELFLPAAARRPRKLVKFAPYPRKQPENKQSSSLATVNVQQLQSLPLKMGDDAGGNGSTDFVSLDGLNLPSPGSEEESAVDAVAGLGIRFGGIEGCAP